MNKIWIQLDKISFSLYHNEKKIGTLIRGDDWAKQPTTFNIYSEHYKIENRSGLFRKNSNLISDDRGEMIVDIKLGFDQKFKYQNREFRLIFDDTLLWKWTIIEDGKTLTSYEISLLHPELGPNIECKEEEAENYMFDFILGNLTLGKSKQDLY